MKFSDIFKSKSTVNDPKTESEAFKKLAQQNSSFKIPVNLPKELDPLTLKALKIVSQKETIDGYDLARELDIHSQRAEVVIDNLIKIGVLKDKDESPYRRSSSKSHPVLIKDLDLIMLDDNIKHLIDDAENRRKEIEKESNNEYNLILKNYQNYIEKFCELAYGEVKAFDEWGDENSEALVKLKVECIARIAKNIYKESFEKDTYGSAQKWLENLFERDWTEESNVKSVAVNAPLWVKNLFNIDLPRAFGEYCEKKNSIQLKDSEDLNNFTGREFEIYIANLLEKTDFNVSGTPITGDQGADLIATKDRKSYILQLKRSSSSIGNKAIQEVVAAKNFYDGDVAVVVTNSLFTQSAKSLARKNRVILIDKKGLPNIIELLRQ